jgi:hypothetical protein
VKWLAAPADAGWRLGSVVGLGDGGGDEGDVAVVEAAEDLAQVHGDVVVAEAGGDAQDGLSGRPGGRCLFRSPGMRPWRCEPGRRSPPRPAFPPLRPVRRSGGWRSGPGWRQ